MAGALNGEWPRGRRVPRKVHWYGGPGTHQKEKEATDRPEESSFKDVVGREVITPAPIYLVGPDEREFDELSGLPG